MAVEAGGAERYAAREEQYVVAQGILFTSTCRNGAQCVLMTAHRLPGSGAL